MEVGMCLAMESHTPAPMSPVPPPPTEVRAEHGRSVAPDEAGDDDKERAELVQRAQWLRAAILGANDGLLSTTALMLGVGAAKQDRWSMIVSGIAGAVAGAFSMAVGEFVSVSTQRDIEQAGFRQKESDVELPRLADAKSPGELRAPATAPGRNLPLPSPGRSPMMKVIATEKRNEEGDRKAALPSPARAAAASGLSFLAGSLVPLLSCAFMTHYTARVLMLVVVTSVALAGFGGVGAYLGGSPVRASAVRVLVGGWAAMGITYCMLKPLGTDKT